MNRRDPSQQLVLIVDDDTALRKSVAVYLEDSGFDVLQAGDGPLGLKILENETPDVILLDLRMPEMDGLEFLSGVQKKYPDLPVIVVSGAGVLQDAIAALRLGAFDFITKPVLDMTLLENAIRKAIERTQLLTQNRKYREHLETEIKLRTSALEERSLELEKANKDLTGEICEHQRTTEALKQSEARLNEIIQVFDGFIYTCTKDHRITFMNQRMIRHVGRDATSELCYEVLYNSKTPCSWCPVKEVFEGKTIRKENKSPVDNRWYFSIHIPLYGATGSVEQYESIVIDITDRKMAEEALRQSEAHLREENVRLRTSLTGAGQFGPIIGKSSAMQQVYDIILKASLSNANVIIYGESGTGKELVAKTIHKLSHRKHKKMIVVNCGAIPDNLVESEFFGYKKGSFTGANVDKPGFLASAHKGTLFLDEVGEINPNLQVKLLRAIAGDGYTPIGSRDVIIPDIRFVAATNKDLKKLIEKGKMREDFYYRLHIIPIYLPALRERREDIPLLIHHFLQKYTEDDMTPVIPPQVMKAMQHHEWRGNVRELENAIHRFVTLKEVNIELENAEISVEPDVPTFDLFLDAKKDLTLKKVVEEVEKKYIVKLLKVHKWHRTKVAGILGMDRRTLFRKMKEYGLDVSPIGK